MSSNMRVLVTGAGGQLGREVIQLLDNSGYQVFGFNKANLDVTNEREVQKVVKNVMPKVIIHCAAYTKVDEAERKIDHSFLVNAIGTRNIAVASEAIQSKLVYISTDYVFNGEHSKPIHEFLEPEPVNIYGESKLAGERFVREFHSRFFIVRASWIYGQYGNNFVKTMLRLADTKKSLKVVNDQIGSPTYALDLARTIIDLMNTTKYGVYHVSNSGSCTWYEFAQTIFEFVGLPIEVIPVGSQDFPQDAKRPEYSVFDHMALRLNGFSALRHWKEGLQDLLKPYSKFL